MTAPYAPMEVDRVLITQLMPPTLMEMDPNEVARFRANYAPMRRPLLFIATISNSLPILEKSVAVAKAHLEAVAFAFASELDFPQQQEDEPGLTDAIRISRAKSYLHELNDYMAKARALCVDPATYLDEEIKQELRRNIKICLGQMLETDEKTVGMQDMNESIDECVYYMRLAVSQGPGEALEDLVSDLGEAVKGEAIALAKVENQGVFDAKQGSYNFNKDLTEPITKRLDLLRPELKSLWTEKIPGRVRDLERKLMSRLVHCYRNIMHKIQHSSSAFPIFKAAYDIFEKQVLAIRSTANKAIFPVQPSSLRSLYTEAGAELYLERGIKVQMIPGYDEFMRPIEGPLRGGEKFAKQKKILEEHVEKIADELYPNAVAHVIEQWRYVTWHIEMILEQSVLRMHDRMKRDFLSLFPDEVEDLDGSIAAKRQIRVDQFNLLFQADYLLERFLGSMVPADIMPAKLV